ncbi:hypothetical protein LX36DRAFT_566381 [Colletotrichum falcatum]|nr:hypothetical protein LX36DRAFT_566381 [Colletotrichum falcatum]
MDYYISNYTSDESMLTLRHRWEELLPSGSGNILVNNHSKYQYLTDPIQDEAGSVYVTSWTHQLHCLVCINYCLFNSPRHP